MIKFCQNCGRELPYYITNGSCSWDCTIMLNKKAGGKIHTPNNLPIRAIRHDGLMLEHEHGDHPNYLFPVKVEFIGQKSDLPAWDDSEQSQQHALIYYDTNIAITLYECSYAMWLLKNGENNGGRYWKKDEWRLSSASIEKIKTRK